MIQDPSQIVSRIRELREILEIPVEKAAEALGITKDLYCEYENGSVSIPINAIYILARLFSVDVTVLLTGEAPRMDGYTVVRAGQGTKVSRYKGYAFESLAANYIGRDFEPMIVKLEAHDNPDDEPALVSHAGQEFNYVIQGTVKVVLGPHEFILNPGDSVFFNAAQKHGQRAVGGPAVFMTIIQN